MTAFLRGHPWGFVPGTPTVVYADNDGGMWRSTDGGATWTGNALGPPTINTGGLQTGLLYHMDIQRDLGASVTLGAFLDNGQGQSTGSLTWQQTSHRFSHFRSTGCPNTIRKTIPYRRMGRRPHLTDRFQEIVD